MKDVKVKSHDRNCKKKRFLVIIDDQREIYCGISKAAVRNKVLKEWNEGLPKKDWDDMSDILEIIEL